MRRRWRRAVLEKLGVVAAGGPLRALLVAAWILLGMTAAWRALGWSLSPAAQYYKFVDEVRADLESWRGKRLLVHGCVVPGSIRRAIDRPSYRFQIQSCRPRPRAVLDVSYSGDVPDAFRSDAEVVVKGTLARDGTLDVSPDGIMAKCPCTKYDSGGPAGPTAASRGGGPAPTPRATPAR